MNSCCVALVCDAGYAAQARFVSDQIAAAGNCSFDTLICSPDDIDPGRNASHFKIDVDDFIEDLPANARLNHFTYWRIPAIQALASRYERIVYLDTDVFVGSGRLHELVNINLQGAPLAAVLDVHQRARPNRMPREYEALGLTWAPYFNAGVLVVDGAAWLRRDTIGKVRAAAQECRHALTAHDQSLLNLTFRDDWLEISPTWNWQFTGKTGFVAEHFSPSLVHFIGGNKIWSSHHEVIPAKYYRVWQRFGESAENNIPNGWDAGRSKGLLKFYLKNLWYLRSTLRYLERFPDDLTGIRHYTP